jgi:hypothetical protein
LVGGESVAAGDEEGERSTSNIQRPTLNREVMRKDYLFRKFKSELAVALYLVRYPKRSDFPRVDVIRSALDLYFNEPLFRKQVNDLYQASVEFAERY